MPRPYARCSRTSSESLARARANEVDQEGVPGMNGMKGLFALLQKIGKALMLPVSVLPVAGILLGVGAAGFDFIPKSVSAIMEKAGGSIFGNLPLIFAIGVALGLSQNDGVAALAAVIGYVVLLGTMGVI